MPASALLGAPVCAETVVDNGLPNLYVEYPYSDVAVGSHGGATTPPTDYFVIRICEVNSVRPLLANYDTPNITAGPLRVEQAAPARSGSHDRSLVTIDPVAVPVETQHGLSMASTTARQPLQFLQ